MSATPASRWLALAVAALCVGGGTAEVVAETAKGAVVTQVGGVSVDWSRGMVIAEVVAPADRRAPAPAVARSGARRRALERARAALIAAAKDLPWAPGGAVAAALPDQGVQALTAAAERGLLLAEDYSTDGSVRVTMGLPIEAVRTAVVGVGDGARAPAASALVVDARKLAVTPAVGIAARAAGITLKVPVVLAHRAPGATVVGAKPHRARAHGYRDGVLELDGAAPDAAMLVVLVK